MDRRIAQFPKVTNSLEESFAVNNQKPGFLFFSFLSFPFLLLPSLLNSLKFREIIVNMETGKAQDGKRSPDLWRPKISPVYEQIIV